MDFSVSDSDSDKEIQENEENKGQIIQSSLKVNNEISYDMSTIIKNDNYSIDDSGYTTFLNQTNVNQKLFQKNDEGISFLQEQSFHYQHDSKIKNKQKFQEQKINQLPIPEIDESSYLLSDQNKIVNQNDHLQNSQQIDIQQVNLNQIKQQIVLLNEQSQNIQLLSMQYNNQNRENKYHYHPQTIQITQNSEKRINSLDINNINLQNSNQIKSNLINEDYCQLIQSNKQKQISDINENQLSNKIQYKDVEIISQEQQREELIKLQNQKKLIEDRIQFLSNTSNNTNNNENQQQLDLKEQYNIQNIDKSISYNYYDKVLDSQILRSSGNNNENVMKNKNICKSFINQDSQQNDIEKTQSKVFPCFSEQKKDEQKQSKEIFNIMLKDEKELIQEVKQEIPSQLKETEKDQNNLISSQFKQTNKDQQNEIPINLKDINKDQENIISSQLIQTKDQQNQILNQQKESEKDNQNHISSQFVETKKDQQNEILSQLKETKDQSESNKNQQNQKMQHQEKSQQEQKISSMNNGDHSKLNESENYQLFKLDISIIKENKYFQQALQQKKSVVEVYQQKQVLKQPYISVDPRDYQEEIFKNSRDGNYIIFLETGTGKTLVSLMNSFYTLQKYPGTKVTLIQFQYLQNSPFQLKIAFLANQVSLIEQQYSSYKIQLRGIEEYFKDQNLEIKKSSSNIKLSLFHGKQNLDFWNRQYWRKCINETDILFFSAQVFLNGLRRGCFELKQFKTIIFDECHNANNYHPFSQIMKEFYFENQNLEIIYKSNPFIIGLSATPYISDSKQNIPVLQGMLKLAKYIDCGFAKYDMEKVKEQISNTEQISTFYEVEFNESEYQYIEMNNIKGFENSKEVLNNLQNQYDKLKDLFQQLQNIYHKYSDVISQISRTLLKQIIVLLEEHLIILIIQIGIYIIQFFLEDILEQFSKEILKLDQELDEKFKEELKNFLIINIQVFQSTYSNIKYTSNKVQKLKEILRDNIDSSENLQLIFCNSKIVVKYLNKFIQETFKQDNPECDVQYSNYIMGQNSYQIKPSNENEQEKNIIVIQNLNKQNLEKCKNFALLEAEQTVHKHKEYNLNLFDIKQKHTENQKFKVLVSTSVSEEGFDIPHCKSVIAFSRITSTRQFTQMQGRARAKDSQFFILIPQYPDVNQRKYN